MPNTETVLERLKRLDAAATPGTWLSREGGSWRKGERIAKEYFVMRAEDDVAICADCLDPKTSKPSEANADFIAAMRNALPALIAAADAGIKLTHSGGPGAYMVAFDELKSALAPLTRKE